MKRIATFCVFAIVCSAFADQTVNEPYQFIYSSNIDYNISVTNGGAAAKGFLIEGGDSGSDADLLKVTSFDGQSTFFNVKDGNVGVGTDSPGSKFTVVKPLYSADPLHDGLVYFRQSTNPEGATLQPALELYNGGGNGFGLVSRATNNYFSGKVGIGEDAPTQAIDFGGRKKNIKFDYAFIGETGSSAGTVVGNNIRASTTVNSQLEVGANSNDAAHAIYMKYNSGWHFLSLPQNHGYSVGTAVDLQSNTRMMITTAGNVGIGTTTPANKLDVNGTIRAKEVIVETDWADHVFADGYELMPLSEVDAHIRTNRRLPGVPSAAEVAENGVSLAESQALLLEKIEELTLHMIEKDERIEALEKRLIELDARLGGR